jgi:hypothetical protein
VKLDPNRKFRNANNSMTYTDQVLVCNSCGERYDRGFITEIKDYGSFCHLCFRAAFEKYFDEHLEADFVLIRGVNSLAYRRSAK